MDRLVPEMTTGARSEGNLAPSSGVQANTPLPRVKGERVFVSKFFAYRLQLSVGVPAYVNPATGERVPAIRSLVAQFRDGVFRTKNPEMISLMEQSPRYGLTGDFWDAEEVALQAARATVESNMEALRSNPEYREMMRGLLQKLDAAEFPEDSPNETGESKGAAAEEDADDDGQPTSVQFAE